MENILNNLYLFWGISIVIFSLTGGVIGYFIGFRQCNKAYGEASKYMGNSMVEELKRNIKY
ncbi:hypothetical protein K7185_08095 [Clostridium butyricum]|uniref:hypothetical protein n=1 Tax=Clostridium butyricum TaxID=1492 RepID=UPI001CAA351B|nr:hypothetical protein [Clostridium butyricum]MBZ0312432.1 hypothetical protein [Clostridium butyricum]